jgi:predicted nucleotidyltransferase
MERETAMKNLHLVLPVGTQVVTRRAVATGAGAPPCPAGAVGEVVAAPADYSHDYRVRLADGGEVSLRRDELSIRKHEQAGVLGDADEVLRDHDLHAHVVYRCVVGSRAYGLEHDASDTDLRGVYLPPAELHWSLYGVPGQLENPAAEECYWELQKFLGLALKANPNILECLYTPLVLHVAPVMEELLAQRHRLLSRMVYQTFNGYVLSQFKRLEADFRATGAPRWKHAMHLVRLQVSGITALREGHVPVRVQAHRERLLAVKRGEMAWDEVNAWRLALHRELDAAYAATRLPERPDYEWANDFLVRARRSAVRQGDNGG